MKKIMLINIICLISLLAFSVGADTLTYKQNDNINLAVPCVNEGAECSSITSCEISIFYPDSTLYVNASPMQNNGNYHNYSLPTSQVLGTYTSNVFCTDGTETGQTDFQFIIRSSDQTFMSCPDTTKDIWMFGLILAFILILLLIGIFTGASVVGIVSSLMLLIFSFKIVACFVYIGLISMFLGLILLVVFIAKFSQGEW